MSTPTERLEATVWLDATCPELPPAQRAEYFALVDDYYRANPIAERGGDIMRILREDNSAFARILATVQPQEDPTDTRGGVTGDRLSQ